MTRTEDGPLRSRALVALVLAVDAAALAALATLPAAGLRAGMGYLILLAGLGTLAGARPVRIPSLRAELTATHLFILFALGGFDPLAATLVALAGVLAAAVGRGRRPATLRFAFNLGGVVLSTVAASWVFLLLGGRPGQKLVFLMLPLAAATAVYFVANTGLVACAIALEKRQPLLRTWSRSFLWTALSYFAGLTLAVAMLAVFDAIVPWGLVLGIPPCLLLLAFYRTYAANLELREANRGLPQGSTVP